MMIFVAEVASVAEVTMEDVDDVLTNDVHTKAQHNANIARKQNDDQKSNYTEKVVKESKLFMAHTHVHDAVSDVWFIDSGCSNHMSGSRSLFRDLEETPHAHQHQPLLSYH